MRYFSFWLIFLYFQVPGSLLAEQEERLKAVLDQMLSKMPRLQMACREASSRVGVPLNPWIIPCNETCSGARAARLDSVEIMWRDQASEGPREL